MPKVRYKDEVTFIINKLINEKHAIKLIFNSLKNRGLKNESNF